MVEEALCAEEKAIKKEKPKYNIVHSNEKPPKIYTQEELMERERQRNFYKQLRKKLEWKKSS